VRRLFIAVAGIAVSISAVLLLALTVDLGGTIRVLGNVEWLPLAAALLIIATQLVVRAARWRILLPARGGGARVPLDRLLPVLLVGYLGNSVLPARLGELIRAYLVSVRERITGAGALGSVVLERVVDVSTLAALAFLAALLANATAWIVRGTALAGLVGLGVLVVLVAGGPGAVARVIPSGRLREVASAFAVSAGGQPAGVLAAAVGLSCVAWGLDATTFFLVGRSLSLGISYPAALLIGAVTILGTAIPSAPGYIGTFELAAVAGGTALGLGSDQALALALVAHGITTLPVAAAGGVALAVISVSLRGAARGAGQVGQLEP
jgi:uncharacterized membrane protein YbhN (UPF0104 family)